ncbi:anaerobic ribonucleoside-triphosphate reductase activating protein [Undibacterium danionis]|uniref:Anaerobic ribonucleoside-triphosphate reductase activating protein n=1 Tax=Undibacterium danionis TaxID=1812100 RepID=A0ABV6IA47_9BURK
MPAATALRTLKVGGITKFSSTDYPGKLSLVVFVQGCPWRCGYCHNPHLQTRTADAPITWASVLHLLRQRVGFIDAVVFSGGEATIDPALSSAIDEVRQLGFAVGLHTACIYPRQLQAILPKLDWVGFDIKAPFHRYPVVTGKADSGQHIQACTQMILASGVDYECRTTVHPALLSSEDILNLAYDLSVMGVTNYAIQLFRSQGCLDTNLQTSLPNNYLDATTLQTLQDLFPKFIFRQNH